MQYASYLSESTEEQSWTMQCGHIQQVNQLFHAITSRPHLRHKMINQSSLKAFISHNKEPNTFIT